VGMTRAADHLYFTAANYYGEGKRERKISPFVIEALGKKAIEQSSNLTIEDKQLSLLEWNKPKEPEILSVANQPVTYLSYSQIETFNNCPLQYRYRYIQRIPVPPSAAQSFGDSIHKTLRDFYKLVKEGRKLKEEDLIEIFSKNWIKEGYASKSHEKKSKKEGEKILRNFYQKEFNLQIIPHLLEHPFVVKISPNLKIGGKIDRIDKLGKEIEIIDYKTGKAWEQKEVDNSLQMSVYALAAINLGIFEGKPEEIILSFYFLENGEKKSTRRTGQQLTLIKEELIKKAKEIQESKFEAKPSNMCDFCEYRLLCEAWS